MADDGLGDEDEHRTVDATSTGDGDASAPGDASTLGDANVADDADDPVGASGATAADTSTVAIREIRLDAAWEKAVPVLRELWSDEDEAFVRAFREEDDYHALGAYRADGDDELLAVAGVSVQRVLHHARHAWVHDFVVTEPARGDGVGSALLDGVETWARERDCEYVALAVRDGNDAAHGFYDAEGMTEWGSVYEREL